MPDARDENYLTDRPCGRYFARYHQPWWRVHRVYDGRALGPMFASASEAEQFAKDLDAKAAAHG